MGTPYTTEADKLISDIRSFQAPDIPTPPPTIPKLTGFGDRLARIGGFGDDPGELKTKEELEKMTQAEIDAYVRQRKQARRLGTSEALIRFGEALQGKPAAQNALAREQARRNLELQSQYQKEYENAIRMAEQTNPQQARLLRSLGLPGYINVQQKRAEEMFLGGGGGDTEFERNIAELNRLKNIPEDQQTETDKRNIRIYENKLLKTTAPKIFQVVGPNNERAGLATYDEFSEGLASGVYPAGSTIVNIPTGTEAPQAPKPEVFSVENKPFADKWQATSNLQQNLQNYTNELQKMDEAALTGVGAGATFANSLIQNTKGFLSLASKDTKSFYNEAVAKDSYTTLEGNDFTERLKAVSRQTGVNESQVRDLAYLFAAARGQEGRGLSDKDYDNALQIVSGGVGKEGKIAVIESVYNRLGGEISNAVDARIRTLQYLKENSPEIEESYFDRQITQLNALKEATPFNPYINPLKQESLKPDPYKLRTGT